MLVCCYIVVYFQFTRNKYLKVLFSFLSVPLHCMCLSSNIFKLHPIWFQEMTKLLNAARLRSTNSRFGSGAQIFPRFLLQLLEGYQQKRWLQRGGRDPRTIWHRPCWGDNLAPQCKRGQFGIIMKKGQFGAA